MGVVARDLYSVQLTVMLYQGYVNYRLGIWVLY